MTNKHEKLLKEALFKGLYFQIGVSKPDKSDTEVNVIPLQVYSTRIYSYKMHDLRIDLKTLHKPKNTKNLDEMYEKIEKYIKYYHSFWYFFDKLLEFCKIKKKS